MAAKDSRLFQPLKVGNLTLSNRLVMAPLTRFRADHKHVPLPFVGEYYAQRGCVPGTLLITEATFISKRTAGYDNVPGIYNHDQIAAWKDIVDQVHAKGSFICLQLWGLGRAAKKATLAEKGYDLVAPSAIPITTAGARSGGETPRELTEDEIQQFIEDYATAAKNAVEQAGFDMVEVHGANGYLVDQFTQDVSNHRTDKWGGSIENRARFGIEVMRAVAKAIGPERTSIRLSPWSTFQSMRMKDPIPQFSYLITELQKIGPLAYLHVVESRISGNADVEGFDNNDFIMDIWKQHPHSPVLHAGGFKPDSARRRVDEEQADREVGIVFGRYFISTPDLVYRIQNGIELEQYDRDRFYAPMKPEGYIDYPFSEEFKREHGESKL